MKSFAILAGLASLAIAVEPVTPELFNRIKSYAVLAGAATVAAPCFGTNNGYVAERQLSTDADYTAVAATLFRNDKVREYVLSFAATNNSVNTDNNFKTALTTLNDNFPCGDAFNVCKIHTGFKISYGDATNPNDLAYMVRATIKSATAARPGYALTIAGASLGAALASQAFLDLSNQKYAIKAVWSYGEPRVGNGALVDLVEKTAGASGTNPGKYYRVTHYDDAVVKIPVPGFVGPNQYQHSRTEYWFARQECDSLKNDASSTFRCNGREDGDCNFGTFPTNNSIRNHMTYPGFFDVKCTNRPFDLNEKC